MHPQGTRLGTYLLWLVLAISIPLVFFIVGTIWWGQNAQEQQQERVLLNQAQDASQRVNRIFERVQNALLALASSSALDRGDLEGFTREMHHASDRAGGIGIAMTTAEGEILTQVAGSPTAASIQAVQEGAHATLLSRAPVISNLLVIGNPKSRAVAVAVPIFVLGQARPSRTLVATFDNNHLANLVQPLSAPVPDLIITVRDRAGITVARTSDAELHVGTPAPPGLRPAISGRSAGLLEPDEPLNGASTIEAFSLASVSGYTALATVPRSEFGAPLWYDLLRIALVGLVFLTAGLLAAAYMARRLVTALHAVEHGNPHPTGLQEVDELAGRLQAIAAERDATEATLRNSEARLRELVGTLDLAAIMARELDGRIRFWSLGCVRMYGWTREEAVGQNAHQLLRTEFPVPLAEVERSLLTVGEWRGDLVHYRRDGTRVVASAYKALNRDPLGGPQLVAESLVDISALRQAQDALLALNQELEQRVEKEVAAREIAQQRAEQTERIQALSQLAGGIAHDFNNVLQAIAGGAALIGRRPYDVQTVERLVPVIRDAAARGASITKRMLLLARKGVLVPEPIDARSLLQDLQGTFVRVLEASIQITADAEADLPYIMADKAQTEIALVNLVTNALDAMPNGGSVRLAAALEIISPWMNPHPAGLPPGSYARLSVSDNGTGMTQQVLARVFEPFFTTKEVGKGTGLGLAMVKGFADQSGGGVAIESAAGIGTTATLWLPIVPGATATVNAPDRFGATLLEHPHGRILLVDDDDLVRDTLMEQLQELGHKVLTATGGADALSILRAQEALDLIITDLSMPGMNGLTLIKAARNLRPRMPAILLTGYPGEAATLADAETPQDSYTLVRKPTTSAFLNHQVAALLARL